MPNPSPTLYPESTLYPGAENETVEPAGGFSLPLPAVLAPREQPPVASRAYEAWLGPLRFVTVINEITETLGEALENVGATLTAAERRPRPFKLTLPVRGDRSEDDPHAAGLRLRRQVRQLVDNAAARMEGLFFWFGADPELQGWMLVGGGDLTTSDGGIVHADFKLDLTDCYLMARPGQARPAHRLELTDHRAGTAPRDTRRTLYSTDHGAQALPDQPLVVPGDTVRLTGVRGRPLDVTTTVGPTVAARALWRSAPVAHGDVVDYVPDPLALPEALTALRDLDPPGQVRAWDITAGVPVPAGYTSTGDLAPDQGYGWERVVGQSMWPTRLLALDNGWCRVLPDITGRIRLERLDPATGTYRPLARLLIEEAILDFTVAELLADRAVIAYRTANRELRVILQRGWSAPRLEAYHDAPAGQASLLFLPAGAHTRPAQTPAWVTAMELTDTARILLAPAQAGVTVTDETVDAQPAVRFTPPAGQEQILVAQAGLALAGDGLTADQVASLAVCDARSVPTLVASA